MLAAIRMAKQPHSPWAAHQQRDPVDVCAAHFAGDHKSGINTPGVFFMFTQSIVQTQSIAESGIGLGSVIAVVCSWQRNRSILWAILAGILSWLYVIYFAITRTPSEQ
ncbi:MAG TPA: hypothetical protein VL970_13830 [Candidatus Acidoferrales bacterium]|nr:hypothetical protein [Candidatus Acidoferrales bacterium]